MIRFITRNSLQLPALAFCGLVLAVLRVQIPTYSGSGQYSSLLSLLSWLLFLEILSLALLPFFAYLFKKYPDCGFGISKAGGLFVFGIITWAIAAYFPLNANRVLSGMIFIALIILSLLYTRNISFYINFFSKYKKHILYCQTLYISGFLWFAFIRFLNPEIYWGEKPMDLGLLYFFTRSETFPPTDLWSSGTIMRYYYLGSYIFGAAFRLLSIDASVGYNLSIASIAAFCLASFYSFFTAFTRNYRFAIIASIALIFFCNPEIFNLLLQGNPVNFDTFWAATRLFTPPGFTEYPLWSYLFADLHAHVISQAACAILLAVIPAVLLSRPGSVNSLAVLVFYSILLSSLMLLNTWDLITYSLLTALIIFSKHFRLLKSYDFRSMKAFLFKLSYDYAIIAFSSFIVIFPYIQSASPESAAHYGWNGASEYNTLSQLLRHFGVWVFIALGGILAVILKFNKRTTLTMMQLYFPIFISTLPILIGMLCYKKGLIPPPWGILIFSSLLCLLSIIIIILSYRKSINVLYAGIGLLITSLFWSLSEPFFLIDRMNTVFKFYHSLWFILGSASLILMFFVFQKIKTKCMFRRLLSSGYKILLSAIFIISIFGALINTYIMTAHKRTDGPRFTLNGQAYLEKINPTEYSLIKWINSNIKGNATILEAQGSSYGPFTRIVMHTGLSTILGWEHHVKQRGTPQDEVIRRREDIKTIYNTTDVQEAENLLEKYKVQLIVIGKLERETYQAAGLDKFAKNPGKYPLLFKEGDSLLFTRSHSILSGENNNKLEIKWTH